MGLAAGPHTQLAQNIISGWLTGARYIELKTVQDLDEIDLKDSKNFAYIKITGDRFPRITIARTKEADGVYFGPFVSGAARDYVLKIIKKIFKIRSCKKMPKKACVRYQIDLCSAPCINAINENEYGRQVRLAKLFLKGRSGELKAGLTAEMKQAASELNYEHALELKKKIDALDSLSRRQKMSREKKYNEDILNYVVDKDRVYLMLFNVYRGLLENKQEFTFDRSQLTESSSRKQSPCSVKLRNWNQ